MNWNRVEKIAMWATVTVLLFCASMLGSCLGRMVYEGSKEAAQHPPRVVCECHEVPR